MPSAITLTKRRRAGKTHAVWCCICSADTQDSPSEFSSLARFRHAFKAAAFLKSDPRLQFDASSPAVLTPFM